MEKFQAADNYDDYELLGNKIIADLLKAALNELLIKDEWLLKYDLSEQSITHKLAEYLQQIFPQFNVDCEYNGNIESENKKKWIQVLKTDLAEANLLKVVDENEKEGEIFDKAVIPDIVIHKRGTNNRNLLIIEVKKSTSTVSTKYDKIKLKAYTSKHYEDGLQYQIGAFIMLNTGKQDLNYGIEYYSEGKLVDVLTYGR